MSIQTTTPECPSPPVEDVRDQETYLLAHPDRKLLSGPNSRWQELRSLLSITWDLFRAYRTFHFVGPCVTIFGSARIPEDHPWYELARETAAAVSRIGFTVMTGGGPGIMEAANRGAREAGGRSVGCNIRLPHEQHVNPYVDHSVEMEYFFTRKTILIKYSYAFVVLPGGLGTMDELFEALTLIQTGKLRNFPVILMGSDYWTPMMSAILRMRDEGLISPEDLDLLYVTDHPEEVVTRLKERAIRQFRLRRVRVPVSNPLLGERQPYGFRYD